MKGINKLSKMSGLSKETVLDITKQVIKNNKKLNKCKRHNFSIDKRKIWECTNCGGYVYNNTKTWYDKGLEHSEKELAEIKEVSKKVLLYFCNNTAYSNEAESWKKKLKELVK